MAAVLLSCLTIAVLFADVARTQSASTPSPTNAPPTPPCEIDVATQSYSTFLGTSLLYVDLVTDPQPTPYQWIISLCNRTRKTPYGTSSCASQLPSGTSTYYAAQWNPAQTGATSACLVAYDQVVSGAAVFAPGGYVNVTVRSSLTGATLTLAFGCGVSTQDIFAWITPEVGSTAALGTAVFKAAVPQLCAATTTPAPTGSGSSGGGDGVPVWAIVLIVILAVAVVVAAVVLIRLLVVKSRQKSRVPPDAESEV